MVCILLLLLYSLMYYETHTFDDIFFFIGVFSVMPPTRTLLINIFKKKNIFEKEQKSYLKWVTQSKRRQIETLDINVFFLMFYENKTPCDYVIGWMVISRSICLSDISGVFFMVSGYRFWYDFRCYLKFDPTVSTELLPFLSVWKSQHMGFVFVINFSSCWEGSERSTVTL